MNPGGGENGLRTSISINKVSAPKSYDLLAQDLRNLILNGDIVEGSYLPTERELVQQSGLSRGSVREALRLLSAEGLVEARQGRTGGSVVTLPNAETFKQFVTRFVLGRKLPPRAIHEAREIVEPALARLAALRRTEQDLQHLDHLQNELLRDSGNFARLSTLNIQWHVAVADASKNELMATFFKSISAEVVVATTTEVFDTPVTRARVIKIHGRINDAIRAQDADLAERLMRAHTSATSAQDHD